MGQKIVRQILGSDSQTTSCWHTPHHGNGRHHILNRLVRSNHGDFQKPSHLNNFVDLNLLPPELGLQILKNLNATDLCLASCVWEDLANDESLWEGLCHASWGFCSAYRFWKTEGKSFKQLFLLLDEGSLTFNTQPEWGMEYLIQHEILDGSVEDTAKFFHLTNQLCWQKVRLYIRERQDVLEELLKLQNYRNQFLPNALRKFFHAVDSPTSRGDYLTMLIDKFSQRFCADNPNLHLSTDVVSIVCYSLILLSVDLSSPHVKNKMSKREFVRNICRAIHGARNANNQPLGGNNDHQNVIDRDFAGHLYDNVYLVGHVAPQRWDDNANNLVQSRRH